MEDQIKDTIPVVIATVDSFKRKIIPLTLPSGHIVEVYEKVGILECAAVGHIPMNLFNSVFQVGKALREEKFENLKDADLEQLLDMLKRFASVVIVNPKVSYEKDVKETVYAGDIPESDLFTVFTHAMSYMKNQKELLRPFRDESILGKDTGQSVRKVRKKTI